MESSAVITRSPQRAQFRAARARAPVARYRRKPSFSEPLIGPLGSTMQTFRALQGERPRAETDLDEPRDGPGPTHDLSGAKEPSEYLETASPGQERGAQCGSQARPAKQRDRTPRGFPRTACNSYPCDILRQTNFNQAGRSAGSRVERLDSKRKSPARSCNRARFRAEGGAGWSVERPCRTTNRKQISNATNSDAREFFLGKCASPARW